MDARENNKKHVKIFYLCDGKACENCNSVDGVNCKHTSNVAHAKNFEVIGNNSYEKEIPPIK